MPSPQFWTKRVKASAKLRRALEPRLNHYIPRAPTVKQTAFLLLDCEEAFYGGAGGGGKSEALLMAALQYADVKGYIAGLFRRNLAECYAPGGLVDLSHEYLNGTSARWNGFRHRWTFPEGSTLTFAGIKELRDVKKQKGAYYQYLGFDELTEFERGQYMFMFSRLRRRVGGVPVRIRGASNPGGEGHIWVKRRMVDGRGRKNRIFIPARLEDNPHIDQEDYMRSLDHLGPVLRAQIRRGDWTVSEGGKVFKRDWFPIQRVMPSECRRALRFWDLAGTEPHKANKDPDYTAGLLMSSNGEKYFIGHVTRFRGTAGTVENLILQRAQLDTQRWERRLTSWLEQEPGSSGKQVVRDYRRLLAGYHVRFDRKTSKESKRLRANPFASQAEGGNVVLIQGPWNEAFLEELESFPDGPHDDQVDAASGAFAKIRRRMGRDVVSWLERATPLPQRRMMARGRAESARQ